MTKPEPTNKQTRTNIIIESPPFSTINGKEGVDLALVCAAFDQQINLIFADQGVFHLINSQDGAYIEDKLHDKQLNALEFYDIEKIYVESESLDELNLTKENLIENVSLLSRKTIRDFCDSSNQTVVF